MSALLHRLAAIEGRLRALERRLVKRRPDTNARRMTRLDRTPYGWKACEKDQAVLVEAPHEQELIRHLVGMATESVSYREICRRLDAEGYRRRGGKRWAGAHGLVRSILRREGIFRPADAEAALLRRLYRPIGR